MSHTRTNKNICLYCFGDLDSNRVCIDCGRRADDTPLAPHHLAQRCVLVGKYLIVKSIGEGGFGITYSAWDLLRGTKVAIKEYYPNGYVARMPRSNQVIVKSKSSQMASARSLKRFIDEAKMLTKVKNLQGIVSVKDFFSANGTAYIVMEYLDGISLKKYIKRKGGRLPIEDVILLLKPIMLSLMEVHALGLIHRDISPDNILITRKGEVKLIDFGAAKQNNNDGDMSIVLKQGFAPEEQYRSNGEQGPFTDIYALSVTIYYAITGQLPPESIQRLFKDNIVRPSQLGIRIPITQELALMRGLSVYAKNRFQDMNGFMTALTKDLTQTREYQMTQDYGYTYSQTLYMFGNNQEEGKNLTEYMDMHGNTHKVAGYDDVKEQQLPYKFSNDLFAKTNTNTNSNTFGQNDQTSNAKTHPTTPNPQTHPDAVDAIANWQNRANEISISNQPQAQRLEQDPNSVNQILQNQNFEASPQPNSSATNNRKPPLSWQNQMQDPNIQWKQVDRQSIGQAIEEGSETQSSQAIDRGFDLDKYSLHHPQPIGVETFVIEPQPQEPDKYNLDRFGKLPTKIDISGKTNINAILQNRDQWSRDSQKYDLNRYGSRQPQQQQPVQPNTPFNQNKYSSHLNDENIYQSISQNKYSSHLNTPSQPPYPQDDPFAPTDQFTPSNQYPPNYPQHPQTEPRLTSNQLLNKLLKRRPNK